jgi:hypothetical protein
MIHFNFIFDSMSRHLAAIYQQDFTQSLDELHHYVDLQAVKAIVVSRSTFDAYLKLEISSQIF